MSLRISLGVALCLLAGCASSRVVEPAQTIAKSVAAFQADLSNFQKATQQLQQGQATLATGNDVIRKSSAHALDQLQTAQALAEASTFEAMLKILQTQANTHLDALVSPPAAEAALASASLPIEQLGTATQMVQKIAKPPSTHAELQFLADFAKTTNADLSALENKKL
jgi:hypothetical protein